MISGKGESMGKINVLVVRPMEGPVMEEVENTLEGYYAVMGCDRIQCVYPFGDEAVLVCDDLGKFRGEPNRILRSWDGRVADILHGTFFICGIDGEEFASLPEELADKYTGMFRAPESIVWS